jgi:NAD(P)-dependent dehydrogenase (short-subunit alcohol dehydrogenase family)
MPIDPLFDFTGKVALVTGGSRGLGYQMVKAFAERGADVVVASRKLDACEAVAEECRALGRKALAVSVHAGRWDEIDRLIDAAYAEFGRVDILVNNAGMGPRVPSHEVTEQLFDSVVNLNFKGPFRTDIAKAWPDEGRGAFPNPRGRAGDPEDIVTAALFLASPASVNVTGSLVRCDGGQH